MKVVLPLIAVLAVVATLAHVFRRFVSRIPNGANVQGVPAVGHADKTGDSGALDPFGEAFRAAGNQWTTALCQADSDGDGQTNGEELGDPCCTWAVNDTPKFSTGVSSPGDPSSKVSASDDRVSKDRGASNLVRDSDLDDGAPANATEAANAVEIPAGSHAYDHSHGSHDAGSASEYASSAPAIKTPSAPPSSVPTAAPTNPPTATSSAATKDCVLAALCLSVAALALV